MTAPRPVLLCVLDGWGLSPIMDNNAIAQAKTPNFDHLWSQYDHTTLRTDGDFVGLPDGQFGNSEVGHTNIGAGRVVMQDLPRISKALKNGALASNPVLQDFIARLKKDDGHAHVMGLVSDGGVHAHIEHLIGLCNILHNAGVKVIAHLFTDGRDTAPSGAAQYVADFMAAVPFVTIGTISGRYYAMDRDNRWERTELAWRAIIQARGVMACDAPHAVRQSYAQHITDEFILPSVIDGYDGFFPEDGMIMANFRSDRARQILHALTDPDFTHFSRGQDVAVENIIGMVSYAADIDPRLHILFPPQPMTDLLGQVLADAQLTQLRAAETEKYPHVTFFFNGGREEPFVGEERILVPSPKVATYDLQPEMSAIALADAVVARINEKPLDVVILNFANADMVGHSGDLNATIMAVECVDTCLGHVVDAVLAKGGVALITADHGNAEQMWDTTINQPYTAHTTNPVPLIIAGLPAKHTLRQTGCLADLAPTMLKILGIAQPDAMTGISLL